MSRNVNNFDGMNALELMQKLKSFVGIDPLTTEICLGNNCCSSDFTPIEDIQVRVVSDENGKLVKKIMLYPKEEW